MTTKVLCSLPYPVLDPGFPRRGRDANLLFGQFSPKNKEILMERGCRSLCPPDPLMLSISPALKSDPRSFLRGYSWPLVPGPFQEGMVYPLVLSMVLSEVLSQFLPGGGVPPARIGLPPTSTGVLPPPPGGGGVSCSQEVSVLPWQYSF